MLRDGSTFEWSTVALLGFAIYVYAVEVERRRFDIVLAGLAFWLMDWFNELANSAVLHATGTSAIFLNFHGRADVSTSAARFFWKKSSRSPFGAKSRVKSSRVTSLALCQRSSGSFARQRETMWSSSGGVSG